MNIWGVIVGYVATGLVSGTICYFVDYFFNDGEISESSFIQNKSMKKEDWAGVILLGTFAAPLCVLGILITVVSAIRISRKNDWKSPWTLQKERQKAYAQSFHADMRSTTQTKKAEYQLALGKKWTRWVE